MPCFHCYSKKPYEINLKRWRDCQTKARAQMLASGWTALSGKFREVHERKSLQLFKKG
jgi:hypothetical protein